MTRIAKKTRLVKRQKAKKQPVSPTRYTIRKDSLERRYAIEKRTGQRVSLYKAEKERKKRREAQKAIPRYKTPKLRKPTIQRSRAAKKGWATRKAKAQARSDAAKRGWDKRRLQTKGKARGWDVLSPKDSPSIITTVLKTVPLPPGVSLISLEEAREKVEVAGRISDRYPLYPKVEATARLAFIDLQREILGQIPPYTPRKFDRLHGKGEAQRIRWEEFGQARDIGDIDYIIERLLESEENDYTARELYTLYFSPEVA